MKLSFTTLATPDLSGIEAVRLAKRYGYQGVDLRVSEQKGELSVNSTESEITELKQVFREEGITCSSLLCYNDTGGETKESWYLMEESIKKHLYIAEKLGVQAIRVFTGLCESGNRLEYYKKAADSISNVLQSYKTEVAILIQNHQSNCTAQEAVFITEQLSSPHAGIVFSPDHCIMKNEDIGKVTKTVMPYVKQLYIADIDRQYHGVLPGRGQVPFKEIYHKLLASCFDGWLTFKWEKIWHQELCEPEISLPYFINYMNETLIN